MSIGEIIVNAIYLDRIVVGNDRYLIRLFHEFMNVLKRVCENYKITYIDDLNMQSIVTIENYSSLPKKVKYIAEDLFSIYDNIIDYSSKIDGIIKNTNKERYEKIFNTIASDISGRCFCESYDDYGNTVIVIDSEITRFMKCSCYYRVGIFPNIITTLLKKRYNIDSDSVECFELIKLKSE